MKLIQFALLLSHIGRILATDSGEVSWYPAKDGVWKSFHPKAPSFEDQGEGGMTNLYGIMEKRFESIVGSPSVDDFSVSVVLMGLTDAEWQVLVGVSETIYKKVSLLTAKGKWPKPTRAAGSSPPPKMSPRNAATGVELPRTPSTPPDGAAAAVAEDGAHVPSDGPASTGVATEEGAAPAKEAPPPAEEAQPPAEEAPPPAAEDNAAPAPAAEEAAPAPAPAPPAEEKAPPPAAEEAA